MSRVLITGASQGVGRATALELIARGHHVVATARDASTLSDLGAAQALTLDVLDQDSVDQAVAAAGELDALVLNAGQTSVGPVETTPLAEFERMFQLNTIGALRVTQAALPAMRERGDGRLLFVSSIIGRLTLPLTGAYAASKWALEAIAETLALEAGRFGVRVSLLEPGRITTQGPVTAQRFLPEHSPYAPKPPASASAPATPPADAIDADEVARAIADALGAEDPALRIPVGAAATLGLADHRAAPDDRPFVWEPRTA
jgi:NAD(P)-dependent dehydrogenase (short-subunit alcohol dehydrogenase family)